MKKILCTCFGLAVLLTSCSDDDSSPGGNNSPLVSTTQKIYENGDVEQILTSEYDNGKIIETKQLTPDFIQTGYTTMHYTNNNLLSSMQYYAGDVLSNTITYNYDNQQRMTSTEITYMGTNYGAGFEYTYNSDNTITGVQTGTGEQHTFHLNDDGYIYKQIKNGTTTYELTYNGNIPINCTVNGTDITTYEYDNTHDFSLANINMGFGNFKPNAVLQATNLPNAINSIATKYLIKETRDGFVTKHIYTFNDQGLPIKKLDYYNDVLRSETEYFYDQLFK